jgi:hypothetical protein
MLTPDLPKSYKNSRVGDCRERQYDAFEHLRLSLFAKPRDIFILLTAYFDETNTSPNQKVPVVAGYIASEFQWRRFGEQWNKLLYNFRIPIDDRYGIRVAHRSELHRPYGAYKDWDDARREAFIDKAQQIIRRHTKIPIGSAVAREDFDTATLKRMRGILGGAYGWCAYTCLHQVKRYCDEINHKQPVRFVFELGGPKWRHLNKLFEFLGKHQGLRELYRAESISFDTKKLRPLHAADFLAYDLGHFFLDQRIERYRPVVMQRLDKLLGANTDHIVFWDKKTLAAHAEILRPWMHLPD